MKNKRLRSIDALRGFDMLFIMGGGPLLASLAVLFPTPFFQAIAEQTEHVDWNGLRMEDLIFPLFLFIAGISFPFSFSSQKRSGKSSRQIVAKVVKRALILVGLGILYNGFLQFDFGNQRYASVLGRIGLAWMFAAILFIYARRMSRIIIAVAILIGYWGLLVAFGREGDPFSIDGSFVGAVDRALLPGVLYNEVHDPEGILGIIPAIVTAMLGMFSGELIKDTDSGMSPQRKVTLLLAAGVLLIVVGEVWNIWFPINKNLWTSSFVCAAGGISAILFAIFYYIIDVRGCNWWTLFFVVIGMNSITIYMAQEFIRFGFTSHAIFGGIISLAPDNFEPLLSSAGYIAVCWGFLYFLYKKNIFLKV